MHLLSDNDLDRMSREAAEQIDVDQRPSGWEQLEQGLDKELPVQKDKDRRRFIWIFFLFLLAGGSGLVWMISGEKQKNKSEIATSRSLSITDNKTPNSIAGQKEGIIPGSQDNNLSNKKNPEPSTNEAVNNQPAPQKIDSPTDPLVTSHEKMKRDGSVVISGSKNKSSSIKQAENKKINSPQNLNNEPGKSGKKNSGTPIVAVPMKSKSPPTKISDGPEITSANSSKTVNQPDQQVTIAANTAPAIKNAVPADSMAITTNTVIAAPTEKKNTKKSPVAIPFSLGLNTGMDFSRINGTGNSKPGYSFGLQLYYSISKRWSVNTGLIYTKKNYSAMGEDFTPPKHYWTNYVYLTSLEGYCNMWDIPINIRYNISIKPTVTWYVSSGMSSYIMAKQAYTYYYTYNNVPLVKDWETNSQQNEWFKIVNISAGIEKSLNKSWSLQAEPYIKLPISGIGFGNMNISSYGIMAGLRYRPLFHNNKTTQHSKNP